MEILDLGLKIDMHESVFGGVFEEIIDSMVHLLKDGVVTAK